MSVLGLEPRTNSLKGYCSAIELYAHFFERQTILTCTPESVNRNHKTHYFLKVQFYSECFPKFGIALSGKVTGMLLIFCQKTIRDFTDRNSFFIFLLK